jgi:hypothetical protein
MEQLKRIIRKWLEVDQSTKYMETMKDGEFWEFWTNLSDEDRKL